jgi:hypothetical protein|tara:strand:- start:408 stop:602 length:195 start_codon:yes stop_codon:yes gene_type:complete
MRNRHGVLRPEWTPTPRPSELSRPVIVVWIGNRDPVDSGGQACRCRSSISQSVNRISKDSCFVL